MGDLEIIKDVLQKIAFKLHGNGLMTWQEKADIYAQLETVGLASVDHSGTDE